MSKSTRKSRSRKAARPKKPYPDFSLSPHSSGTWQKKIRGKIHYFGRWGRIRNGKMERIEGDGWKEALEAYKAVADDLHAGRTPSVQSDGLTVADLCNRFLTAKLRKREAGELGLRTCAEYKEITDLIVAAFGKTRRVDDLAADDFEALRATMAERWGPVRLGNAITRVKSVFKYGLDNGLIDIPIRKVAMGACPPRTSGIGRVPVPGTLGLPGQGAGRFEDPQGLRWLWPRSTSRSRCAVWCVSGRVLSHPRFGLQVLDILTVPCEDERLVHFKRLEPHLIG